MTTLTLNFSTLAWDNLPQNHQEVIIIDKGGDVMSARYDTKTVIDGDKGNMPHIEHCFWSGSKMIDPENVAGWAPYPFKERAAARNMKTPSNMRMYVPKDQTGT